MKKIILVLVFSLFALNVAYAETILLKCEFIDGKLDRYKDNKFLKVEKINDPTKEHEIKLNTALKKIIEAPYHGSFGMDWEIWQEDYIQWKGVVNIALKYDTYYTYTLDRVTGVLTEDRKSTIRIVKDGHYQKDANGKWKGDTQYHITSTYQCEKKDRLF